MPRLPTPAPQNFAPVRTPFQWSGNSQGFTHDMNQMMNTSLYQQPPSASNVMDGLGLNTLAGEQRFASPSQQQSGFPSMSQQQSGFPSTSQQQPGFPSQLSSITAENINGLMQKSMSELTVADIIQINIISNDPIQRQLTSIETELKGKIQSLDNRMNILEQMKTSMEEENTILRSTISNMQKSLNRIDSDTRNKNVIITGLPEDEIPVGENQVIRNDEEKIGWILRLTENDHFNNKVEPFNATRLGEPKPGYNRVLKIILQNGEERNEFLKNSIKMKDAPEPWKKVYIKKDQHPVYLAENNRLRKKVADLKKKQGNENKDIKIHDGKVLVDNTPVDRNLFFR